jgi:hypothetical protein
LFFIFYILIFNLENLGHFSPNIPSFKCTSRDGANIGGFWECDL